MADNDNIKEFTALDIEKYWQGKLSPQQMHSIEKAALDDPFLADALEGYKNTVSASADVELLLERLNARTRSTTPVINLKRKRYTWTKVAAAIIVISGIGLLVQQLLFDKYNQSPIVSLEQKENDTATKQEISPNKHGGVDTSQIFQSTPDSVRRLETKTSANKLTDAMQKSNTFAVEKTQNVDTALNDVGPNPRNDMKTEPVAGVSASAEKKTEEKETLNESVITQVDTSSKLYYAKSKKAPQPAYGRELAGKNAGLVLTNTYNYRVVDARNNPIPFANVTNMRDNAGTYTDVRGNFNFISPDSPLHVQIRSLGYNSANYKLTPSVQRNALVLKEDERGRKEIVSEKQNLVMNVTRKDSVELEEPAVGWSNYNTYVANNMQIPDDARAKNSRNDVELSFDVDKEGNPINIKVTKSSQCKACDDEAIRLLKEGPKWKRKGKKSKTTISIAVDQKQDDR